MLEILSDLIDGGVAIRLMHAKEPGPRFREDFDRYPNLVESDLFERILCPRIHTKAVVIDGKQAFIGSANLTGAIPIRRDRLVEARLSLAVCLFWRASRHPPSLPLRLQCSETGWGNGGFRSISR